MSAVNRSKPLKQAGCCRRAIDGTVPSSAPADGAAALVWVPNWSTLSTTTSRLVSDRNANRERSRPVAFCQTASRPRRPTA